MKDDNVTTPLRDERDEQTLLDQAGQAMFRLGRVFSRYPMRDQFMQHTWRAVELSRILVAEAVAVGSIEPDQEVTVGVVAERLSINPSTASRLVAETVEAGYLVRIPSHADSRRIRLELTSIGRDLVENAHRYQRSIFEYVTHGWTDSERQEFARLLLKFVASVTETHAQLIKSDMPSQE